MSVLEESIKSEIKWHNDRGQRSHEYDGIFGEIRIYESGPIKALYGEYVLPTQKKFAFLASFKKLPFVNWYGSKEPIAIVTPVREPRTPIANGQKNKTLFASYEVEWFEEENPQRIISSISRDRVILLILGVCVLLRAGLNWKKETKTE